MGSATRYLCAAVYLDDRIRHKVLWEFIHHKFRSIAPSYDGFDLAPVLEHCLRARRISIIRDLAFVALLILFLWLKPISVIFLVAFATPFAVFSLVQSRPSILGRPIGPAATTILSLIVLACSSFLVVLAAGYTATSSFTQIKQIFPSLSELWLGMLGIALLYRAYIVILLRRDLAPGTKPPNPSKPGSKVGEHIAWAASAQFGNVTLHARANPFIGAGDPGSPLATSWSFTIDLDRPRSETTPVQPVDPWELQQYIRRSIEGMGLGAAQRSDVEDRDGTAASAQSAERITGLRPEFHVIAYGRCPQYERLVDTEHATQATAKPSTGGSHPLIDDCDVPYSLASDAMCEDLVRNPHPERRCYQRVVLGIHEAASKEQGIVAPAESHEIVVSAYIHVVVEGRMLYTDFVATVLPPVLGCFRIVDEIPAYSRWQLLESVCGLQWPGLLGDAVLAPFRVVQSLTVMALGDIMAATPAANSKLVFDYGARVSARELGSQTGFTTYSQVLDAHKYISMITQRMNSAVLDYLKTCEVDTSSYSEQMTQITNMYVQGNNYGVMKTGPGHATQKLERNSRA
ncbi:hypothetical protein [Actinomadura macra]|uniref:hypothetical protein n=1 Tax=Actinomadura macra TaxID=46164 RepID=UPI0012FC6CD6|nr:hypothetical protein [Actinomadura macra]